MGKRCQRRPRPETSSQIQRPILCRVCLDEKNVCYNYGVLCCKACSQFFIRSVQLGCKYRPCRKKGTCFDLTERPLRRHMCRVCRYNKCIDCGMNSNLTFKQEKLKRVRLSPIEEVNFLMKVEKKIEEYKASAKFGRAMLTYLGQDNPCFKQKRLYFNMLLVEKYSESIEFFGTLKWKDQIPILSHFLIFWLLLENEYCTIFEHPEECEELETIPAERKIELLEDCKHQELLIIKCICFCCPDIPNISSKAQSSLSIQRDNYTRVLLKYCLQYEGADHGHIRYGELVTIMEALHKVHANHFLKQKDAEVISCTDEHSKLMMNAVFKKPSVQNVPREICNKPGPSRQ